MDDSEKLTLVVDVPVEKFSKIIKSSSIDNKHFSFQQFEKNFDTRDLTWCLLFNTQRESVLQLQMSRLAMVQLQIAHTSMNCSA